MRPEILSQSRHMRSGVCEWRMNCCGIFCNPRKEVRAKAKYAVIYRHREQYPVLVMCRFFAVSRSGYYSFVKRRSRPQKDELHPKSWTREPTKGVQKSMGKELFTEELKLAVVSMCWRGHTRKEASRNFVYPVRRLKNG